MTPLDRYKHLVQRHFGTEALSFNVKSPAWNPVTRALAAQGDHFTRFRANFDARLRRLSAVYGDHVSRRDLLTQVNLVADANNWQGAVAELAAFDFFNSCPDFLPHPPVINVDLDPKRCLAGNFGAKQANIDLHFDRYDIFTDVKVLKDNAKEIFEGIYKELWPQRQPMISATHPLDSSYHEVRKARSAIRGCLRNEVANGRQADFIDCNHLIPNLSFRLRWNGGVFSESAYDPYRHAEELHRLPWTHAKKFVRDAPFFLTFVSFPWFNQAVNGFLDSNRKFYRSLARRVFCQYRHEATSFSAWCPDYGGHETVHAVSQHLGAILFLEDGCITAEDAELTNVSGYYFSNPNAHHSPSRSSFERYLHSLDLEYDDFSNDNY